MKVPPVADYTPEDPVPDAECPFCRFTGYMHREVITEEVDGVMVTGVFLVCEACYGREPDVPTL
jgi:hypothetical protein